jgi:hypothetical protein
MATIQEILNSNDLKAQKALFQFDSTDSVDAILLKYNLWSRSFYPQYFESADAPFHEEINRGNIDAYLGNIDYFVDVAFRGAGKDVKTKLFIPFVITNDTEHRKKYFKVLSADITNSRQTVTDIYNMLINPNVTRMYPEIFEKTIYKREETMSSFTTATGIKVLADTVGTDQRGAIQEETRPDFLWCNDFESRKTLRSAVISRAIRDNMEEARTSLQKGGCCIYTCNYVSEMGNVHQLVTAKLGDKKRVLIIPILKDGQPTWSRYTLQDIEQMRKDDDDFEGERMCFKPDTLIYTEIGLRPIDTIKVGDMVWTHEGRLQKVVTVFQSEDDNLLDITVDGKITTITRNHPVLVKRGGDVWVHAEDLSTDDLLVKVHHDNINI